MAKINKIYPSFFNGVSEQNPELLLDNQCKEMVNCTPSLVEGLKKRPPAKFVTRKTDTLSLNSHIFHTYDRGEDNEEYIFLHTGDYDEPIRAFNKAGEGMNVEIFSDNEIEIRDYLSSGNLKGLTVQDRTWIVNKDKEVIADTTDQAAPAPSYDRTAYYWLKRGSGDRYNPYNYSVYLNGTTYSCNPNKPSGDTPDPATGFEDSDYAANYLASVINGATLDLYEAEGTFDGALSTLVEEELYLGKNLVNVQFSATAGTFTESSYNATTGYASYTLLSDSFEQKSVTITIIADNVGDFVCEVIGSLLKIYKEDGADFTFDSWDSWGSQASVGWKGSVNKLSDLPKEFAWDGAYVEITGDEQDEFTNYYVKWNGSSWEETIEPTEVRGILRNMPIKMDRTALVNGVATFTLDLVDWSEPKVGNSENNPDPSFVGYAISDLFFYKNRLGVASSDSVVLSEAASYTDFYISTAVAVLDTDPIDVAVASNQASKIYYVKPFNNSLYVFTKYSQYELTAEGGLSPKTVSLNVSTNYPMDINVEPIVVNNSLYFISTTNNRQQLREYIKTENLDVKGIDLNVSTPTYIKDKIVNLHADGVLGTVLCCTDSNKIYLYKYTEDGTKRIQSSWSTWELFQGLDYLEGTYEYNYLGSTLTVTFKTETDYRYHTMELDHNIDNDRIDTTYNDSIYYESSVLLPDFYPKFTDIRTPKDKILIKKIKVEGEGSFDVDVYRKDYDRTFNKTHTLSMRDLDLHISSKVGNVEITIKDSTVNDFVISSIILEGLYTATSKEIK